MDQTYRIKRVTNDLISVQSVLTTILHIFLVEVYEENVFGAQLETRLNAVVVFRSTIFMVQYSFIV